MGRVGAISLASGVLVALLLAGCAHQTKSTKHSHEGARYVPQGIPESNVPYGKADWDAVVAALGGAKKQAGKAGKTAHRTARTALAYAGGKVQDLAAGVEVTDPPTVVSKHGFAWPSQGKISRGFRPWDNHKGIDVLAPTGTPIYASRTGRVIYSDCKLSGFGNCIILQHENGITTFYAHNDKNYVVPGDRVAAGQLIATVGQTGRASAPHLHFEIRRDGIAIDPKPLLP